MILKEFGSTGIKLSTFGFGGGRFRNGKSNEENVELAKKNVRNISALYRGSKKSQK